MSVGVGVDPNSWLQQDGGESPADVMPDVTGNFWFIVWFNNLDPAVVEPDYKAVLVLFTTADLDNPSYDDPYALVRVQHAFGAQCVSLIVNGVSTPKVTTGLEKRCVAVAYNATNHHWTLYLRRTAAWEIVGTIEQSFVGTPITQMRMLNDGAV